MTWLRWETTVPQHEIIGHLATALRIHPMQALGHYVATCCGFGNYVRSGQTLGVQDVTLEGWANWPQGRRTRGRFAAAFRELCVEHRDGQPDDIGVIKGWWRNKTWLAKQEKDRKKPGEGTRKARTGPRGANRGPSGGNVDVVEVDKSTSTHGDVYGNEKPFTTTTEGAAQIEHTPVEYAVRCTVAANSGLRKNPAIGSAFTELVASNNFEEARQWRDAGIPLDLASNTIYEKALEYPRPPGSTKQPHNLKYFRNIVLEAAERERQRSAESGFTPAPPHKNGSHAPPGDPDNVKGRLQSWINKGTEHDTTGTAGPTHPS